METWWENVILFSFDTTAGLEEISDLRAAGLVWDSPTKSGLGKKLSQLARRESSCCSSMRVLPRLQVLTATPSPQFPWLHSQHRLTQSLFSAWASLTFFSSVAPLQQKPSQTAIKNNEMAIFTACYLKTIHITQGTSCWRLRATISQRNYWTTFRFSALDGTLNIPTRLCKTWQLVLLLQETTHIWPL